jgi:hypothetical protein
VDGKDGYARGAGGGVSGFSKRRSETVSHAIYAALDSADGAADHAKTGKANQAF